MILLLVAVLGAAWAGEIHPPSVPGALPYTAATVRVTVDATGQTSVAGGPPERCEPPGCGGPLAASTDALARLQAGTPGLALLLAADATTPFLYVRTALATAQAAGLGPVYLESDRPGAAPQALLLPPPPGASGAIGTQGASSGGARSRGNRPPPSAPPPPPLTLEVTRGAVVVYRKVEEPSIARRDPAGSIDVAALEKPVLLDRTRYPAETLVIVNVDDNVSYADAVRVLGVALGAGFTELYFVGGPPRE